MSTRPMSQVHPKSCVTGAVIIRRPGHKAAKAAEPCCRHNSAVTRSGRLLAAVASLGHGNRGAASSRGRRGSARCGSTENTIGFCTLRPGGVRGVDGGIGHFGIRLAGSCCAWRA
jgi:hypothetical protein